MTKESIRRPVFLEARDPEVYEVVMTWQDLKGALGLWMRTTCATCRAASSSGLQRMPVWLGALRSCVGRSTRSCRHWVGCGKKAIPSLWGTTPVTSELGMLAEVAAERLKQLNGIPCWLCERSVRWSDAGHLRDDGQSRIVQRWVIVFQATDQVAPYPTWFWYRHVRQRPPRADDGAGIAT